MIPEECLNPFQEGDRKRCIRYLMNNYKMTYREAEKEFNEYRKLYMNNRSFRKKCIIAKHSKVIESYVISVEDRMYVTEEDVAEMYESGMSYAEIRSATGKCPQWIQKALKECGVKPRSANRTSKSKLDPYRDSIIGYLREGMKLIDIAEILNVDAGTLRAYVTKRGLRECL